MFKVEMSLDSEDGERAVVFVTRHVLRGIDFKETRNRQFIEIPSDADVHLLLRVIYFCRNTLENKSVICLQKEMVTTRLNNIHMMKAPVNG